MLRVEKANATNASPDFTSLSPREVAILVPLLLELPTVQPVTVQATVQRVLLGGLEEGLLASAQHLVVQTVPLVIQQQQQLVFLVMPVIH